MIQKDAIKHNILVCFVAGVEGSSKQASKNFLASFTRKKPNSAQFSHTWTPMPYGSDTFQGTIVYDKKTVTKKDPLEKSRNR